MPRIRYLKPEFFSDEDLCSLPYQTRLMFAGLWCYADKSGRLEDRPKFLKVSIFPYDNVNIEKQLMALTHSKPFIHRYEVDGKKYIQIINWEKHQKPHHTERESNFPGPPLNSPSALPLNTMEKGMGMEKQLNPSAELSNGEITVKEPVNSKPFELFWEKYPKKRNKGDAEKAWLKIKPDSKLQQNISKKLDLLKKTEDWLKENGQFIPYPASWLNAKGWEDEVIEAPNKSLPKRESPFMRCPKCGKETTKDDLRKFECCPACHKPTTPENIKSLIGGITGDQP